jgi:carbonic anhydrase
MPDDIDRLLDRNVQWAKRTTASDPTYFVRMAERQTPRYFWIGCSDSRVTANDVLDLAPGSVFVQRNIANIVHTGDLNLLSALEFAVDHLKVKHIMVCGHYFCGGIKRAISEHRGTLTDHWLQPITMLYRKHRAIFDALGDGPARLHRLSEVNVEMQVRRLASTPIVENAWARGQSLQLHGWIYGVDDGLLRDIGPSLSSAAQRDALPSIDERAHALGQGALGQGAHPSSPRLMTDPV